MELTKQDTKMLQGLSVLAMVCLHLFDRDYHDLFTPLLFVQGVPMSFYLGQLSDFCVFGFAFCSGYAHMTQYEHPDYYKQRLKGLLRILCSYWLILILFSLICIIIGQGSFMPGSFSKFILNAMTLENSYNGAWWYMFAYVVLVLLSPMLLKVVKKMHPLVVLSMGFAAYCVAYYLRFRITTDNWLLLKAGPLGMTLFEYLIGAVCCRTQLFTKLYRYWGKIRQPWRWLTAVFLFIAMLYVRTKVIPSLFVAPITGFVVISLFHFWQKPKCIQSAFLYIGKHSTNIWLTHMFFYLVLFKEFVYVAKYPILIFILMLAVTLLLSNGLKLITNPLERYIATI